MSEQVISEEEKKDAFYKAMGAGMTKVQIRLYDPFHNFIKKYLAFFGSKRSVEDFCRQAVYDKVCQLYNDFEQFVSDKHSFVEGKEWFDKWPHIASAAFDDPEEDP